MSSDREQQIRALLPLVRQIARRVHRMVPVSDVDDLFGDGCVGLIRAVDAFDPERGVPLEHYARRVILGAVLNGVRRMDPVSERARRTLRRAWNARYAIAQQIGTMPGFAALEQTSRTLTTARTEVHRRTPLSLDTPLPYGERLDIDLDADPQTLLEARLERERIFDAIEALPPRQRRVVVSHYLAEKRLRDLVAPMQISPQRVSQLHLLALRRLRTTLAANA
jgi:RNA polymerase sigma factor for flagellar operon FliA